MLEAETDIPVSDLLFLNVRFREPFLLPTDLPVQE